MKHNRNSFTDFPDGDLNRESHNIRNDFALRNRLSSLQRELNQIGDDVLRAGAASASTGGHPVLRSYAVGQNAVRNVIRSRANRLKFVPAHLMADPAWDMLLELYYAEFAQRRVSVTGLCIASNVPATTALRWTKTLENEGLTSRAGDPLDSRRYFITLTEAGQNAMDGYFAGEAPDEDAIAA